jgi:hypothetical protein
MEFVRRISIYLLAIAVSSSSLESLQAGSACPFATKNPAAVQKGKGRKARPRQRRRIVTLFSVRPPIDPIPPAPAENLFQAGVLPPELFLFRHKPPVLEQALQK